MIYLGNLGRMIPIVSPASQDVQDQSPYSFDTTLEGKVVAQVVRQRARKWSLGTADWSTPEELAPLADFASGAWGPGPFVFVSADAPVTNMLSPQAASCDPLAGMRSTDRPAGPLATPDGWAPRSILSTDAAEALWFGGEYTPVVDNSPVTASAYVLGSGAAVRIYWYSAGGTNIATTTSSVTATAGTVVRSFVTATPPSGAASLRVRAINAAQGARPSITLGSHLFPWSDGQGCPSAVVHVSKKSQVRAHPHAGQQFSSLQYTVTEVG